jgi:hypothetical protein
VAKKNNLLTIKDPVSKFNHHLLMTFYDTPFLKACQRKLSFSPCFEEYTVAIFGELG